MDRKITRIMNATLALMMTSTSVYAGTATVRPASSNVAPIILAQADCDPAADPNCAPAAAEEPAPAPEPEPQPEPAPEPEPQPAPEPEPPAAEQPAPAQEAPAAEPEAPAAEEPAPEPEAKPRRQQRKQPAQEAPAEQPAEQPAAPAEQPAAEPEAPAAEQPAPEAPAEQPAPAPEAPAPEQPAAPTQEAPAEQPAAPAEQPPAEQPAAPTGEQPAAPAGEQPAAPTGEQPAAPTGEQPAAPAGEQPAAQPAAPAEPPVEIAPNDGAEAPLFDSLKRGPAANGQAPAGEAPAGQAPAGQAPADGGQQTAQPPAEPAPPPPADDRAAQESAQPVQIVPVTEEKGTRRQGGADDRPRWERPESDKPVREMGDRIIIQINNQVIVESDERPRMGRGAREVYYEDLPRGRTRETIVRENGVQVVTVRNQYGDVIRRSRITPDGREYVLTYVDEDNFDSGGVWRDPGDDLPPMRVNIERDDYIFEAERAEDSDDYYEFLREPPVERVKRLYSVDEVKRSARVRDIARRIDLDTIKFAFGKAEVPESEVTRLEGVAKAMEKLLAANPAETFLIEGHTDAVGTNEANLALSDRRAEAVADALSNVFGIPPENLSTQGYGEQYLKVRTQAQNQDNRRVAIRRITPLVAPVASAN